MSRSRADQSTTSKPPLRLRVPASLAVALLGASASVAMTFGGCDGGTPDPVDAGQINKPFDAGADDIDGGPRIDGSSDIDGGSDIEADGSVPEPMDAGVEPVPDAAVVTPVDSAVPDAPDTPDH